VHYLALVLDVGPAMALFFVDGKLCDGGVAQRNDKAWSAGWCTQPNPTHPSHGLRSMASRLVLSDLNCAYILCECRTLLPRGMGVVSGGAAVKIGGAVRGGRLHGHALLVSELVGNWRHGSAQRARLAASEVAQ